MVEKLDLGIKDQDIVAFKVDGKVDLDDARLVMSNIQADLNTPDHFKGYVELHSLEGIEMKALWERLKFGISNFSELIDKVDKVALVADQKWVKNISEAVYKVVPGIELETFSLEESDKAKAWLVEA